MLCGGVAVYTAVDVRYHIAIVGVPVTHDPLLHYRNLRPYSPTLRAMGPLAPYIHLARQPRRWMGGAGVRYSLCQEVRVIY
jgi:hypothetical protein